MKKFSRKSKIAIILVCIGLLSLATVAAVRINHSRKCHNITGDGYAMGTDPQPVVIGNTCDL
jgi:hypothetical protein